MMPKIPKNIEKIMKQNKGLSDMLQGAGQNVPEQMSTFIDQNEQILKVLNDHTLAICSIYELLKEIAIKNNAKIPKPLTNMEIEK